MAMARDRVLPTPGLWHMREKIFDGPNPQLSTAAVRILFAGSDAGGQRASAMYSLLGSSDSPRFVKNRLSEET